MNPTITVVIPVHNGALYIAQAIESVLNQTLPATQIIVVDDASTDETAEVVKSYAAVQYQRLPEQQGAGEARNRGVALAQGEFLAFLDADDYWAVTKLKTQWKFLCDNDIDIVLCQASQFISPDLAEAEKSEIKLVNALLPGYVPGGMFLRRSDFERVGNFRSDLATAEFIDWFARAHNIGLKELVIDEVLLYRRIHRSNLGRQHQDRRDYLRVVKAILDNMRRAEPLNPVLEIIFETERVGAPDGTVHELRAHVDKTSCFALQRFVKQVRPNRIIEVGFAYGISSMAIADVVSKYKRVEYDILDPYQRTYWNSIGIENMRRAGYENLYRLHEEGSEVRLPKLYAWKKHYDFAFIDGNHTFDHALIDFFYINKMLEVGGIVVLDDAYMPALRQLSAHISTYPCYETLTIESTVIVGDEQVPLDIPGRFAAFRKTDHDTRQWDWHVQF